MFKKIICFVISALLLSSCSMINKKEYHNDDDHYFHFELLDNDTYAVNGFVKDLDKNEIYVPSVYNNKTVSTIYEEFFNQFIPDKVTFYIPETITKIYCNVHYNNYNLTFENPKTIEYNEIIDSVITWDLYKKANLLVEYNNVISRGKDAFNKTFDDKYLAIYNNCIYLSSRFNKYMYLFAYMGREMNPSIKIHPKTQLINHEIYKYEPTFIVESTSKYFTLINNNLYSKDKKELVYCVDPSNILDVEKFSDFAFSYKVNDNIHIPKSVKYISKDSFGEGTIKNISLDKDNDHFIYIDNILYTKDGKTLIKSLNENEYFYNETVENVNNYAFDRNKYVKRVELPNVKNIGDYAFSGSSVSEISIPKVEILGKSAFSQSKIKNIELLNVKELGEGVFYYCNDLTEVKFNEALETIPKVAFYSCYSLKNIELHSSLKYIEEYAFSNCEMTEIQIPSSVICIGDYALPLNLSKLSLPENLKYLGVSSIRNASLDILKIPSSLVNFNLNVFNKSKVIYLKLSNGIKTIIGEPHNSELKNIIAPNSLNYITNNLSNLSLNYFVESKDVMNIFNNNHNNVFYQDDWKYDSNGHPYIIENN